jgi:hypothetical protein
LPEETGQLCHGLNRQAVAGGSGERQSDTVQGKFGSLPVFGLAFTEWKHDDILHICFASQFQKKEKKKKKKRKKGKQYKSYSCPGRKINEGI